MLCSGGLGGDHSLPKGDAAIVRRNLVMSEYGEPGPFQGLACFFQ
jgi:hypothetical protein